MTYRTYEIDEFALPLPIPQAARDIAQQFASEQPTPEKAEQVRLNTLAVWVVNDYLQLMDIPTNLAGSDSWQRFMRLFANTADLDLPHLGRLECRPMTAAAQRCPMPPEVWSERVGYVVVQLDEALQEATIRGFVPTVAVEELPLEHLRSPEDLLSHLAALKPAAMPAPVPTVPDVSGAIVNLSQWLTNVVETGWQTLEQLLSTGELNSAYAFRYQSDTAPLSQAATGTVTRAKLFHLGSDRLALILDLQPDTSGQVRIQVQVHPTGNLPYLPPNLQLTILDATGATFLTAESRTEDDYIQVEISGDPGERFSIRLAHANDTMTQAFEI